MIDLHLHTTASDGRLTPAALVAEARAAGLDVIAVTDHDTTAALDEVAALTSAAGLEAVPGIEITTEYEGRDVHLLGYFFDPGAPALQAFLAEQRTERVRRVRRIGERLASLGMPVDVEPIARAAETETMRSVGRPAIARAMVDGGHAHSVGDAFERYLTPGRPGYVPRRAPTPTDAIGIIRAAGGLASLAHPGLDPITDILIPVLAASGLGALEAYHGDHDEAATARYLRVASAHGLAVSGGSDFHGDPSHGAKTLGTVSLPADRYQALRRRWLDDRAEGRAG